MERYYIITGIVAFTAIMGSTIYFGSQSEQRRIECKQQMAATTQRPAEEIVRLCR